MSSKLWIRNTLIDILIRLRDIQPQNGYGMENLDIPPYQIDPTAFANWTFASHRIEMPPTPFLMTEGLAPTPGQGQFAWHGANGLLSLLPEEQLPIIGSIFDAVTAGNFSHLYLKPGTQPFQCMDLRGNPDAAPELSLYCATWFEFHYRGTEFIHAVAKATQELAKVLGLKTDSQSIFFTTTQQTFVGAEYSYFWDDITSQAFSRVVNPAPRLTKPKVSWRYKMVIWSNAPSVSIGFIPCAIHPDLSDDEALLTLRAFVLNHSKWYGNDVYRHLTKFCEWDTQYMRRNVRRGMLTYVTREGCTKGPPKA